MSQTRNIQSKGPPSLVASFYHQLLRGLSEQRQWDIQRTWSHDDDDDVFSWGIHPETSELNYQVFRKASAWRTADASTKQGLWVARASTVVTQHADHSCDDRMTSRQQVGDAIRSSRLVHFPSELSRRVLIWDLISFPRRREQTFPRKIELQVSNNGSPYFVAPFFIIESTPSQKAIRSSTSIPEDSPLRCILKQWDHSPLKKEKAYLLL